MWRNWGGDLILKILLYPVATNSFLQNFQLCRQVNNIEFGARCLRSQLPTQNEVQQVQIQTDEPPEC
jgi:hypothetical protein